MRKQWMVFVAVMTAFGITACGSGDGIVINGTTAGAAGGEEAGDSSEAETQPASKGTTIEIVTGETTQAPETAAQSTEGQPETTAAVAVTEAPATTEAARPTQAGTQPETTAAKVYKVTDMKKTMYATAAVRVRAGYSTSSDVLAGLAKDEKVEVTGQSENGWLRVNYKGHTGYVSKDYLTETVPSSSQTGTGTSTEGTKTGSAGTSAAGGNAGNSGNTGNTGNTGAAGPVGPTAGGQSTSPEGTTGPGGGTTGASGSGGVGPGGASNPGNSGNSTGPTSQGGTTSPGSSQTLGGGSSSSGNSVTGSVKDLDPSGVTVQTSDGTTYQFVWGSSTPPALAPGEKIQIFYETTSSGERRVTNYSK